MAAWPIEVRARARQFLGMSPAQFLRGYWQKRPLLIRGAFANPEWIAPNDLAGLACEELALSRLVQRDPERDRWTLHSGPFSDRDFAKLGNKNWTLLVQDVDKWDMDVASILDAFAFVPSWRIDDVMVSYAEDGGGVGAHVDQYDVFLIQGIGRRRWRIDTRINPNQEFREDVELKLLKQFDPSHDWTLEPGDALYLPPGIAHEGTAIGECMTYSIGMRAPSRAELTLDFAEFLTEPLRDDERYADADLTLTGDSHEISRAALNRVRAAMPAFAPIDDDTLTMWFGAFITRYRSAHEAVPNTKPISAAGLATKLATYSVSRNPWSRMAWARSGKTARLFVAGDSFPASTIVARLVAGSREIDGKTLLKHSRSIPLFADLVNRGHWTLFR
ncbi:MAG: cupin domain-containing protein [Rudaea sp.]